MEAGEATETEEGTGAETLAAMALAAADRYDGVALRWVAPEDHTSDEDDKSRDDQDETKDEDDDEASAEADDDQQDDDEDDDEDEDDEDDDDEESGANWVDMSYVDL